MPYIGLLKVLLNFDFLFLFNASHSGVCGSDKGLMQMLEFRPVLLEIRPLYNLSRSLIYVIKQNLYNGRLLRKNFGQIPSFFGRSPKIDVQFEPLFLLHYMMDLLSILNIINLAFKKEEIKIKK